MSEKKNGKKLDPLELIKAQLEVLIQGQQQTNLRLTQLEGKVDQIVSSSPLAAATRARRRRVHPHLSEPPRS